MSMSLAKDGTRVSVIDSDGDLRLLDLDDRSQLGEYSPSRHGGVRHRPCLGHRCIQRRMGPCNACPAIVDERQSSIWPTGVAPA